MIALFAGTLLCFGQEIKLLDGQSLSPVPYATVTNPLGTISSTSNINGRVSLIRFEKSDSLFVQCLGYESLWLKPSSWTLSGTTILLKQSSFLLNPVVISANKWEQQNKEVNQKVISMSYKEIQAISPQTAADLVGANAGVFVQKSQQGGGSPMIRGFASNRLLYAIDGVRMNTAIFRGGNVHNVISLDPLALQNTEVIVGPGSVVYGSDAIGGVMSFNTLKPFFSPDSLSLSGRGIYRFSSANLENTAHFDFNLANKKWSWLSSASWSDFNSIKMGSHGPNEFLNYSFPASINGIDYEATSKNNRIQSYSGYRQINVLQKISYQIDSNKVLKYSFHFSETSDIPRYDRLIQRQLGAPRYSEWYYGPLKWSMNHLVFSQEKKSFLWDKYRASIAVQNFEESRNSRSFGDSILNSNIENVSAYSVNFDAQKSLKLGRLYYGLEYITNLVRSKGLSIHHLNQSRSAAGSRYPKSSWANYSAYLNHSLPLSDKTVINTGIRYTSYYLESDFSQESSLYPFSDMEIKGSAVVGSIGMIHQISPLLSIQPNLSSGFRAPNVDDAAKVFDSEPGAVTVPNSDLKEERVYQASIGLGLKTKKLAIQINPYYSYLDNAMLRRNSSFNGLDSIDYLGVKSQVQKIQNASYSEIWGIEVEAEWLFLSYLSLEGQISIQSGREKAEGESFVQPRHVAPSFGKLLLKYKKNRLLFNASLVFNGEISSANLNPGEAVKTHLYAIDNAGQAFAASWHKLDFKASYQFHKKVNFLTGIENITDQRYRTYSSGIAAPGRNFSLTIQVNI